MSCRDLGYFCSNSKSFSIRARHDRTGFLFGSGTALIAIGVIVNLVSARHHFRLMTELARGQPPPPRPSTQAIGIAILLALIGLAMVIYLLSVRSP